MSVILTFAVSAVVVLIDQLSKMWAVNNIKNATDSVTAIPYVLNFTYTENSGAAFGLGQNLQWLFIILAIVFVIILSVFIIKRKEKSPLFIISAGLILGGTIGNLIDRIANGYVVDFLQLTFFSPICNFADYCLTVGAVLLIIYVLLLGKKKNEGEQKYGE